LKGLIIPDIQAKPTKRLPKFVPALCKLIRVEKPNFIVQLGDLWDMPSLSSYDTGKKSAEGKRLTADIKAGCDIADAITTAAPSSCKLIYTEGNHEYRIKRYENDNASLAGSLFSPTDYMFGLGWDAYEFLEVAMHSGISFSHFFPRTSKGTTTAASSRNGPASARAMVLANMTTCIAGHKQGLDTYMHCLQDRTYRGIIAGSCYSHNEGYHSPQGHTYWRGVLCLDNVTKKGDFDLREISMQNMLHKYK